MSTKCIHKALKVKKKCIQVVRKVAITLDYKIFNMDIGKMIYIKDKHYVKSPLKTMELHMSMKYSVQAMSGL